MFLGYIPLDEGRAKEVGILLLDLFLKGATLNKDSNTSWSLTANYLDNWNYVFGDSKTLESITVFTNSLHDRQLSLQETSAQSDFFGKALGTVMAVPGDWHSGLNMAQSIFKCHWKALLEPMKDCLGWKGINEQVCGCY